MEGNFGGKTLNELNEPTTNNPILRMGIPPHKILLKKKTITQFS